MGVRSLLYTFFALFFLIAFASCSDDETKDKVEEIKMFVSELTGEYQPWGSPTHLKCMLVKEEYGSEYFALDFRGISDFEYERGCSYELSVEKTTLANPPADAGNVRYKLLEVLTRTNYFNAAEFRYAIDADEDRKEDIKNHIHNTFFVPPVGGGYLINYPAISIVDENKVIMITGELHINNMPENKVFPDSYRLITPEKQIITQSEWRFTFGNATPEYDVFSEKYGVQIKLSTRPWLYMDLTEYYKAVYPNSEVKCVMFVQILTPEL